MSGNRQAGGAPSLTPLQDAIGQWRRGLEQAAIKAEHAGVPQGVTARCAAGIPKMLRPLLAAMDEGRLTPMERFDVAISVASNVAHLVGPLVGCTSDEQMGAFKARLADLLLHSGAGQKETFEGGVAAQGRIPEGTRQ